MYPGQRNNTYNSYSAPQGAPPGYQQQQQYQAPTQQAQSKYQRPVAPPPGFQSGYSQNNGNLREEQAMDTRYASPPAAPQSFGQNTGMNFQYSQCTGDRKALLIGCNYIGTQNELRGCINDANAMFRFLTDRYGYQAGDIVMLTDDQREAVKIPTRANIIRAMQWLVSEAKPNDSLVFHYSGHGGLEKNNTGEEESGYDSCIYPLDFQQAGSIIDDVLHDILVRSLPSGCRLTALFDSCHSGTALDLPYVYSTKGVVKEPNLLKDVGQDGLSAVLSYATGNYSGVMSALSNAFTTVSNGGSYNRQQAIAKNTSAADVIMLSGSKDDQTSADATQNGLATGAMSYAFITVLCKQSSQSYISLLNNMRSELSGKYSQKPQLSASHPIDVNLQFIM